MTVSLGLLDSRSGRAPAAVAVALIVATLAAGAVLATPATPAAPSAVANSSTNGTAVTGLASPPDPAADRLGWEAGYWYNETIRVTRADGLNDSELDAVVDRAAARIEAVRGVEFDAVPPVEVISRAEFRRRNAGRTGNVSDAYRRHQNVKYEALFMINESSDAVDTRESNRNVSVLGYYDYVADRIVVVGEDPEAPRMDEITLAQELFHALQDQEHDLTGYNRSTIERNNAVNGIIEGDGNYVDYLYDQRCEAAWGGCLRPRSSGTGGGGGGGDFNVGVYLVSFQPYSDGPSFVRTLRERGGWAAVDDVYAAPPASTEQVIHPGKYREDAPTPVTVRDRSNATWRVLDAPGIDYAEFGEAGMAAMIIYPTYVSGGAGGLLSPRQFLNYEGDGVDRFDPFNYSNRYTAGWDGDRLYPYVRNGSSATGETGYVWKTVWDSPEDAREFREGYRRLLQFHGAERVGPDTWRLPPESGYGDAVHLIQSGATLTIVNAPTVEALSGIDARARVTTETTTTTTASTTTTDGDPGTGAGDGGGDVDGDGTTTAAASTTTAGTDTTTATTPVAGPGFGPAALGLAVAALAGALLLARRYGRDR